MPELDNWQLKARLGLHLKDQVKALARRRRLSMSRLVESLLARELGEAASSGALPDEQAIRDMAILVAVEQLLKLQEATIPGGPTLSRRLLDDAANSAVARVELIATFLRHASND
jgi:hypothetical protein